MITVEQWLSIRFDCVHASSDYSKVFFKKLFYRYSPHMVWMPTINNQTDYGICLEISRCLKAFGGFMPLFKKLAADLSALSTNNKIKYYASMGHSLQSAWLLSYHPDAAQAAPKLQTSTHYLNLLAALPITLLKACRDEQSQTLISDNSIAHLHNTGFMNFNDLNHHIEQHGFSAYRKRWGTNLITLLEDIFFCKQNSLFKKPLTSHHPELTLSYRIDFDHPLSNIDLIKQGMHNALSRLSEDLLKQQMQTDHIAWHFFSCDQKTSSMTVSMPEPHIKTHLFEELSAIQLDAQRLTFEVDHLCLECIKKTAINDDRTPSLFKHHQKDREWDHTLTRLQARLGESAIYKITYIDNHIPEKSIEIKPINQTHTQKNRTYTSAPRPSWMFKQYIPIRQNHNGILYWQGKLTPIYGPERIENAWWDTPVKRDYFVAQREDNTYLWIFKEIKTQLWFVHGWFA